MALYENGALERHGVEMIGANYETIRTAEDRQLFKDCTNRIGVEVGRAARPPHTKQVGYCTVTVTRAELAPPLPSPNE